MGKATSALKAALQKGVGGGGGKRKSPIRPQLSRTHAHHWEGKGAGGTPSTYSTASERYTDGEELVAGCAHFFLTTLEI
jgi:hypothetical protein